MRRTLINNFMIVSTSLLVLNACMPEEEDLRNTGTINNNLSQLQLYSQSFQQYSSRSLNAFVNSTAWQLQAAIEGPIDLSSAAYGKLNNGEADNYVSSAYCKTNTGEHQHITWFNSSNSDGEFTLKGLGDNSNGVVASNIKKLISADSLATAMPNDKLKFLDNTQIKLSNRCLDNIDIPKGSIVAVYKLNPPTAVAENVTKTILRVSNCENLSQLGTKTEKISAVFTADGKVLANGQLFNSEQDLLNSTSKGWSDVSDCKASETQINLNTQVNSASAINIHSRSSKSDVISALQTHLTNIDCLTVESTKTSLADDEQNIDHTDEVTHYSTCETGQKIQQMEEANIREINVIEDTISYSCMPRAATEQIVISSNYPGIPTAYRNKDAIHNKANYSSNGQVVLNKITTVYKVTTDNGQEIIDKKAKRIDMTGKDINCQAPDNIELTCSNIYSDVSEVSTISGTGPRFTSTASITGWEDPNIPLPEPVKFTRWTYQNGSMNCSLVQERSRTCSHGAGTKTAVITEPNGAIEWGEWVSTGSKRDCDDNNSRGFDVDGDGKADFSDDTAARRAGFGSGTNVDNSSRNNGMHSGTTSGGSSYNR